MIRELYDNIIITYKTDILQTGDLILGMIRLAMKIEKKSVAAELLPRSDLGFNILHTHV